MKLTQTRHIAGTVVVFAVALLGGCGTAPTETCAADSLATGRFSYRASQDSPSRATIEGTLVVSTIACGNFSGSLSVISTDAQGQRRQLAGPVSGRAVSASTFRFDFDVDGVSRQHAGTFAGDSLLGSWIAVTGATTSSGSFHSKREGAL